MLSEKPWKLDRMALFFAVFFISISFFLTAGSAAHFFHGGKEFAPDSIVTLALATLTIHGSILLGTAAVLVWFQTKWADAFGFSTRPRPRAVLAGVLLGAIFVPVGQGLLYFSNYAIEHFGGTPSPQEAIKVLQQAQSAPTQAYLICWSIMVAPIAEEILFRGVLYAGVKQLGLPRAALWGTAVLFAAIHGTSSIFVPLTVLGLALAWLYDRTDNLLAPISAHSAFNAINLLILYFWPPLQKSLQHWLDHH